MCIADNFKMELCFLISSPIINEKIASLRIE
jgi:hypothetical protein